MPRVRPRGTPSAGPAAGVLRAALVLVLLALAAHGVARRDGLDWGALPDAPGSPVAAAVLLLLLAVVVGSVVRALVRLVRGTAPGGGGTAPPRRPRSLLHLMVLLVLLVVVFGLLASGARELPTVLGEPPTIGTDNGGDGGPAASAPLVTVTALAVTLVVLAVGLLVALRVVGRGAADPVAVRSDEPADEPEPRVLAAAVAAAEEQLVLGDEDRTAIVAAYRAMEQHIATAGTTRSRAETPTELLDRAVAAGHAPAAPARALTDLFRRARFSTGPLPAGARTEAGRALADVAAGLRVRRG
jgi:hypothetical protein